MSDLRRVTRKLTKSEAAAIVEEANLKYNAYETTLSERIEAWCVANFNPEMDNISRTVFGEILEAAARGVGNNFSLKTAKMIVEKHEKMRRLN